MSENIEFIEGARGDTVTGVPHTADFRITGNCQLRCSWCWGPEHMRKGSITPDELDDTLAHLASDGMEQVVFSGGEPTISPLLRPGIESAKMNGLSVTLSTNGINIGKSRDLLYMVDDLGIPIDGSTPEINDMMRERSGKFGAWEQAIGAIVLAQTLNTLEDANIAITSRTVVAKPNLHDVEQIPASLRQYGVAIEQVRFKLYQVEPFGPHYKNLDFEADWAISAEEAEAAAQRARDANPGINITMQFYKNTIGRYFLVDPDGFATGTDEDRLGHPVEVAFGNIVHNYDATIDAYRAHQVSLAGK